jgi:hypothetical protein
VAQLAPGLSEGELRLLLELCRRAIAPDVEDFTFRASVRDLAKSARCSPYHLQESIRTLGSRGIITYRAGTATQATAIRVNLFQVVQNAFEGVPLESTPRQKGCAPQGHTTPPAEVPPSSENTDLFGNPAPAPRARVESIQSDGLILSLIDRIHTARLQTTDPEDLARARLYLTDYQSRFGRPPGPPPLEDDFLVRLLATVTADDLVRLLQTLTWEKRCPGDSWGWYETVALQRRYGIKPATWQAARKNMQRQKGAGQAGETNTLVRDLAQRKAL